MVIFGVDSIFGSKNVISESSELISFRISAKTKKGVFGCFSVHSARNDFILGQDARSRLYLSRLRAFVLKCRFDIDFGC